ncbi:hypothetical protein DCAR_0622910 [Daucus carota subsp. sativus]|uniref:Uncharacterized protein n=1 Tax=Daucus carota subsp. sativus TaxID=79200 RepID=A0A161YAM3_DAUCS|nr:hypothetical protein DCAR_0622910 [Daucus carota subsp. sativus]
MQKKYKRWECGNDNIMNRMFVFGDSFVDNGNSNFLETVANADYLPYGMDFPLRPSGRYNNGKTFIDALGDLLNITAFIPPFFDPSTKGNHTIDGANYASSGSGILNETSSTLPPKQGCTTKEEGTAIDPIMKFLSFGDVKNPCCQVVSTEDGGNDTLCTKGGAMCKDRNQFLFFDGLHPTEAVNVVLATKGFNSNLTSDVYPFSIRKFTEIWCHHL